MLYKAKVAVCSDIRTKHSTQSEHLVEFLDVKPGGTPLGFKRLIFQRTPNFGGEKNLLEFHNLENLEGNGGTILSH